ncbi:NACHT domain-containing protein [Thermomonas aquatica]|uniref:NACHT domain-containing protein n=1 Tax=Thermomonas aquatica TaxID=2202149 RepID=UPI00143D3629|nr:NACHT domain-containing protein [Thermomonas aquatica]
MSAADAVSFVDRAMQLFPTALAAAKAVTKAGDFVEFEFRNAHIQYCTAVLKNYCKARTFFVRDEPQYLDEFYVPTSLLTQSRGSRRLEKANLDSLLKIGPRVIVDGTGGSGKTVFMRYLMLDSIERGIAYPVLFELRTLNDDADLGLEDALVAHMVANGFPLGVDYAKKAIKQGQVVLLLDGLDEVNFSRRRKLANEIRRISTSTDCKIVVSSRPDLTLEGWELFSRVRMAPLELEEACELVEKIRFDDDEGIKVRFIDSLRSGLFESHHSFLSNPLLLSIMLLTYGHSADIPKRFSSFYERAYIALFEKHDAYKGYRRERETDLDISEFSALFAAFSTITFNEGVFRFASTDAAKFVKIAKKLASSRDISESGFIEDAKQAVCLLVEEGLDLSFVHRSFQEYFTAKYIQSANRNIQKALIERYGSQGSSQFAVDNVLRYLYELSPAVVEEFYLIPSLRKTFGKSYKRKLTHAKWKELVLTMFVGLHRPSDDSTVGFMIADNKKARALLNLFSFVREVCSESHFPAMVAMKDLREELSIYAEPETTTPFSSFGASDPVWKAFANHGSFFSLSDLDRIRAELIEMEKRVRVKEDTEMEFLLGASGR